jgi:hypothetical protein
MTPIESLTVAHERLRAARERLDAATDVLNRPGTPGMSCSSSVKRTT